MHNAAVRAYPAPMSMRATEHDDQLLVDAIMQHLPDAVWIRDVEGRLITANAAAAKLLNIEVSDLKGTRASDFLATEAIQEAERQNERVLRTGEAQTSEEEYDFAHGRRSFLTIRAPWQDSSGRVGILGIARDITERKALEQSISAAREHLIAAQEESLRAAIEAQEQERERVGRSLHDNLGSMLTSLLFELDTCVQLPASEVKEKLQAMRMRGEGLLRALREVSQALHPAELSDLGLVAALENLTQDWTRVYGIAVDLDLSRLAPLDLSRQCAKALYRVSQEALANVAKHAAAKRVSVVATFLQDELRLTIEDNGIGGDPDSWSQGQGLRSIKDRVRLLGGVTCWEPTPGGGTTLHVQIPRANIHD